MAPTLLAGVAVLTTSSDTLGVVLRGGVVKIDLTSGVDNPSYTFTNKTKQPICDLLLSTDDSDLIDPDFEGNIVVRLSPAGTDLEWDETPAPADGVERIKTEAPGLPDDLSKCIPVDGVFSISLVFDDVGSGDRLWVKPTNADGAQILLAKVSRGAKRSFHMFNGYGGLEGSLDGGFVGTNGLAIVVTRIQFDSSTPGVTVEAVTSSLAHQFDPETGVLEFQDPIALGQPVDYTFSVDGLEPYVHGDLEPFTFVTATVLADPGTEGACCVEGECTGDVEQDACAGSWYPEEACAEVSCASGGMGACCAGGGCESFLTEEECSGFGGTHAGDDTSCVTVTCRGGIPTVSEWGLIVLTLLLLGAGAVVFGRHRRAAP